MISVWKRFSFPTTRSTLDGPDLGRIPKHSSRWNADRSDSPHGERPGDHRVRFDMGPFARSAGALLEERFGVAALRPADAGRRNARPTNWWTSYA